MTLPEDEPARDDRDLPIVAVTGRPNVGKSTLVNRFLGRRSAIVEDQPGVTRDRVTYEITWSGREFVVVDTGGWEPGARGLRAQVTAQAEIAAAAADVVLLVVDATAGITEEDAALARVLKRSGKPVLLVANKVDNPGVEAELGALWALGLGAPLPVSALHGRGSGDLLDAILERLPAPVVAPRRRDVRGIAIVGRPNVGKSSLLNRLVGEERAIVDEVAGTTRDPVDAVLRLGERTWRVVDTAGLRRKVKDAAGAEYYASVRTSQALRAADAAIVVLDATESVTEQDLRIAQLVVDAGRAMIFAFNKWDLVDEEHRRRLERDIERDLVPWAWAPRINISAKTGRGLDKIGGMLELAVEGWEQRIPTARLNAWVRDVVAGHPHPVRGGRQPRILFATQATAAPPKVVLFTTGDLEPAYRRFLERRLRQEFGFAGSPIQLAVRARGASQSGRGGTRRR